MSDACSANSSRAVVLPGRDGRLKFNGIAKTFGLHPKPAECVYRHQPAMRIERNDVREHAAKGEGFGRIATSVHKRVVPRSTLSDVVKKTMQISVGLIETSEYALGRTFGRTRTRAIEVQIGRAHV